MNNHTLIKISTIIRIKNSTPDSKTTSTTSSRQITEPTNTFSSIINKKSKSINKSYVSKSKSKSPIRNKKNNENTQKASEDKGKTILSDKGLYTIFTSNEPSNKLICSNKPIQGKLISSSFKSEKDLIKNSYSLLKESSLLTFDKIFNENISNEEIYNTSIKEEVTSLFEEGHKACLILFGPSNSGKSYSLRGDERNKDKGILFKAVEEVLNLIEVYRQGKEKEKVKEKKNRIDSEKEYALKISIHQVMNDKVYDLLINQSLNDDLNSKTKSNTIDSITRKSISSIKDLELILKDSIQKRKLLSQVLQVNNLKKKSHLIFSLFLEKEDKFGKHPSSSQPVLIKNTFFSRFDFVELASFNEDSSYKQVIKDFSLLSSNLVSLSNSNKEKVKYESMLSYSIKDTLCSGSSIIFMNCVLSNEVPLGVSYNSLKFSSWMRNQIMNYQLNEDNNEIDYHDDDKKGVRSDEEENYINDERKEDEVKGSPCNDKHLQEDSDSIEFNKEKEYMTKVKMMMNIKENDVNVRINRQEDGRKNEKGRNINDNIYYRYDDNVNNTNESQSPVKNNNQSYKVSKINKTTVNNQTSNTDSETIKDNNQTNKYMTPINNSNLNKISYLEAQLEEIEKTKNEVSRYLEYIKSERNKIDSSSTSSYEISRLIQSNQSMKSENIILKEDIIRLEELNKRLEEDLIRQRHRNLEIANELEMETQEKRVVKEENEKMKEKLSVYKLKEAETKEIFNNKHMIDNRIYMLDNQIRQVHEEKQKFEIESKVLTEKYNDLKMRYDNEINESKALANRQKEEISSIELRFERMVSQIESLTVENSRLKGIEDKIRLEMIEVQKQKEGFYEKYMDYKEKYKYLNERIIGMESEFRSILMERDSEVYEKRRNEESKRCKIDSKQRILEEFQSKIAKYKSQLLSKSRCGSVGDDWRIDDL